MQIKLFLDKSVEQNASYYFDMAKKQKRKREGAKEALQESHKKLKKAEKEKFKQDKKEEQAKKPKRKKEWYEKFHWFHSSEGFLVLGGRDATTNEIVIKKHTDKNDLVFHTEMPGSPFFVIKTQNKEAGEITLKETAEATAIYSKAWKTGLSTTDVYYVKPDQVSKEAEAGEYMTKGAFMIRGKRTYLHPDMGFAIGLKDNIIIAGPLSAIKAQTENYLIVIQGRQKTSDLAKKIQKKLKGGELDEIIRMLPAGGGEIKK